MLNPITIEAEGRMRYNDLLREAEQDRLLAAARAARQRRPIYAPLLARLGSMLVALGWRLRARYGALERLADDEGAGEIAVGPFFARRI